MHFSADVRSWKRTEERYVHETYWTKERSFWHWFWFVPKDVKKTRQVLRTTEKRGIEVSKLGDLLEGFATSGSRKILESAFAGWLVDGIAAFDHSLEHRLDDGVKTYRSVLIKRMSEIETAAQTRISSIEANRATMAELSDEVEAAVDWRREAYG